MRSKKTKLLYFFCHKALVNVVGNRYGMGTFDFATKLENSQPKVTDYFADFFMTVLLSCKFIMNLLVGEFIQVEFTSTNFV